MKIEIAEATLSLQVAQAHQRRQAYEQWQQKSRRWRNTKFGSIRKSRSLSPPLRVDSVSHSTEIKNGSPQFLSHKEFTRFQGSNKFANSENGTLSPRSVSSEKSQM